MSGIPIEVLLPRMRGWGRLLEILRDAARHPDVIASDGASEFVALAIELIRPDENDINAGALHKSSAAETLEPLRAYFAKHEAELRADLRNAVFREAERWVVSEWECRRPKAYASKQKFAEAYVKRVEERFGTTVSARNIVDRWLKGH